jgi:metal-responsive CopG/Arc/MetJ family transcriptional regulator
MSGKSISITIPIPLVEDLQEEANKIGISRSRFISNLLLKWQEKKNTPNQEQTVFDTKPNTCSNREDDGFCVSFEHICNANQKEAETCVGYVEQKERP